MLNLKPVSRGFFRMESAGNVLAGQELIFRVSHPTLDF